MNSPKGCDLIPELYNTRAEDMWEIIQKRVSFADKTVLDVGCGRADLLVRAWCAGAQVVYGIDNSPISLQDARMRTWPLVKEGAHIFFMQKNLEHWSDRWPGHHNIIICTSVLPYLVDRDRILKRIKRDSDIAIIECQYKGDGPGLENIKNDDQMRKWLGEFEWDSVERMGKTDIVSRDMKRTLWKCTNK